MKVAIATNRELARIFFEMAAIDEMNGIPFKPRAYELASESMAALGDEVNATWKRGGVKALKDLPGIGQSIAEKIDEYFRTGRVKEYDAMKKKFPVDIWALSKIEGMGPKTIRDLYKHLKIRSLKDLERALKSHKVRMLPRFGVQSEEKLARGLSMMQHAGGRMLLGYVLPLADRIVERLGKTPGVKHCVYAGSIRRRKETVGDIDLLATTELSSRAQQGNVMRTFVSLPEVVSVHEQGKTRASVRLSNGMDADLRVVPDAAYGAALQYFTGDKRHNVMLREFALSKGYTLSEYGLFRRARRGKTATGKTGLIVCKTEDEIYKRLGMDTPPPEIRIGEDEIDAARDHRLPNLIHYGSVRGDLQVQTTFTPPHPPLASLAVTDHTRALAFINGLDDKGVIRQGKAIDALNTKLTGFRVLKGTECDIHADGTLDLKDETLVRLDWVGISVHSAFRQSRAAQTARVVAAMSNPNVDCLFHPTAGLIGKREPIDLDMDAVIAAAKKYRVALEIDAYPERSDLSAIHARAAVRAGVMLVVDSDAHAPEHFDFLPLGEAIARRGWATKKDVLNTKSAKDLMAWLEKKRPRGSVFT